MFALFIVLCGFTHVFNALHVGIDLMLITKFSTAVISLITAIALLFLIPGVLQFLTYTKTLEEEVLYEPNDVVTNPDIQAYLNKRRTALSARWHMALDHATTVTRRQQNT